MTEIQITLNKNLPDDAVVISEGDYVTVAFKGTNTVRSNVHVVTIPADEVADFDFTDKTGYTEFNNKELTKLLELSKNKQ